MRKISKGKYEYKGYIIIKNPDYNHWYVYVKNCLEKMIQFEDNTLRDCKDWIDNEVNA